MKHITEGHGPFSDWLIGLGLRGWLQTLVKGALMVLMVLLLLMLILPCLFQCLQRMLQSLVEQIK